jgi:hypothetical protein
MMMCASRAQRPKMPPSEHRPLDRLVARLAAAAGEYDLFRHRSQQCRALLSGDLNGAMRRLAQDMRA